MPNNGKIKPQLGFLGFGLTGYIALGAAAIILSLSVALKVQSSRLASVKQEYVNFVADVKAKGEAQKVKADAENKLNQKRKEKSDRAYKRLLADNAALKRLRDARPATSGVPQAPSGSSRPDLICFDREAFKRAYGELVTEVRGLADEGTESAIGLNVAREWAQER